MSKTSAEFNQAVVDGCVTYTAVKCSFCNTQHVCDPVLGGTYKEGEYESFVAENAVVHDKAIEYGLIDNAIFVPSCNCNGGMVYEQFLIRERVMIAKFYKAMKQRALEAANEFEDAIPE